MKHLLNLMRTRLSARTLFNPKKKIAKKDLNKILEAGRWAPTAHNMQNFEIILVDDRKILDTIAKIKNPISLTFVRENYNQLSFSKEELKLKGTGILGTQFPPSWRKPNITEKDIARDDHNSFMGEEIKSSPVLAIVLYDFTKRAPASEGDFLGAISLGCVMENMWLMANSLGIGFHILSALSEGGIEKKLRKMLNIPNNMKIAYSFRLGYPVSSEKYLRVRRPVKGFTHTNIYTTK